MMICELARFDKYVSSRDNERLPSDVLPVVTKMVTNAKQCQQCTSTKAQFDGFYFVFLSGQFTLQSITHML